MLMHARAVRETPATDGDFDAVVVRVAKTGGTADVQGDRYQHVVTHGLGRVPIGCVIIDSDKACTVYTVDKNANTITVRFSTSGAAVTLRIW